MEERGPKVSRKNTEYMAFNEANDGNIPMQFRLRAKESGQFQVLGIDDK